MLANQVLNIQSLVDLLDRRQPDQLEQMRQRHPEQASMLRPGKTLGREDQAQDRLLADLLATTVGVAKQESTITYELVSRRIKNSSRLRLVSSVVSATSSGGLVAALMIDNDRGALVAGILTFAASGFILVAQYLEDYAGGKDSLRAMRDRVVAHIAESAQVESELQLMQIRGSFDQAEPMIRKLNSLVSSLRQVQLAAQ